MHRYQIVTLSVLGHFGLVAALFVAGVWRLERLSVEEAPRTSLAVMLPPAPAPEGGVAAAPVVLKPKLKPVKEVVQPPRDPVIPPAALEDVGDPTNTGEGSGAGSGAGSGSAGDTGACTENCGDAIAVSECGNGARETGETCDDGNQRSGDGCSATCQLEPPIVQTVPPTVLDGQWLSGERKIYPSDAVKAEMMRDHKLKSVGVFKVCVDATGAVSSANPAKSIGYPAYDNRLAAAVRAWRFRPLMVNGRPAPFCGMVTFVYVIQ